MPRKTHKALKLSLVVVAITLPLATLTLNHLGVFDSPTTKQNDPDKQWVMQVYKTPTCGCCTKWIEHLEQSNFSVRATDLPDLSPVKDRYAIAPEYRSCHTGVSAGGYIFEGHVPAKFIRRFLSEKPADAIGLSVPAMPVGSPGMEYNNQFNPYPVLLLKQDGSSEVYAEVRDYQSQF